MGHYEQLQTVLSSRGGVLLSGDHGDCEDGCCLLEAVNLARHGEATDSPKKAGMPDLRPLNDARWSTNALRTKHCLPVALALWDWSAWSVARRLAFAERLAIATVRETFSDMLDAIGLDSSQCRAADTLDSAVDAAARAVRAAYAYAYDYAAAAANAARYAARYAATANATAAATAAAAVARSAADATLIKACGIWVRCADETEGL